MRCFIEPDDEDKKDEKDDEQSSAAEFADSVYAGVYGEDD